MRRFITAGLLAAIIEATGEAANAAYSIKLKNGNEYVTARYWQEGSQVLFDTYDGVFGIDKAFISRIDKADEAPRAAGSPERELAQEDRVAKKDAADEIKKGSQTEPQVPQKKPADDVILGEFNRLKQRSSAIAGLLTSEIRALLNEITAFKNKLSRDGKLFIDYGREFNELQEIGATVESALRVRSQ
jgi:hypothetical protein